MIEGPFLWAIGSGILTAAFTGGIAFGTVKSALNGTRQRVKNVEEKVDILDEKMDGHAVSIAEVATKVGVLLDNRG